MHITSGHKLGNEVIKEDKSPMDYPLVAVTALFKVHKHVLRANSR